MEVAVLLEAFKLVCFATIITLCIVFLVFLACWLDRLLFYILAAVLFFSGLVLISYFKLVGVI